MVEKVDVIVMGMGVGGEDVAGRVAEAGLSVVGIDAALVGGECPYWGCVPTKMMIRAANAIAEARRIPGLAGSSSVMPDWTPVAQRIRDEATDDWDDRVAVERFESKGGRFIRGRARITGSHTVEVDGRAFEAGRGIVIATGTRPAIPPIPGVEEARVWTNHEAVEAKELPSSLLILGGGAVGAEFGQVFARFGVHVTIVEALDRLLPLEEPEAGALLAEVFEREGMTVLTGARVDAVEERGERTALLLAGGSVLDAEQLLVATGRRADLRALGVGAVGVDEDARFIEVDERMRAADGVWALGDVTGVGPFTHIATYQAAIAAADILGRDGARADYRALPRVTFTDPEVGSVGLTERGARERGIDVVVGATQVPSSARGWIHKSGNEGFIKLVADRERSVLVGATSVGPHGGEVLSMLTLAVHAETPVETLRSMIYAYPTFHRGVEDALRSLGTPS